MQGDSERLQFLATANPLDQVASEAIESSHNYDYRSAVQSELPNVRYQVLIAWAVIAHARHHVLVLFTEHPIVPNGVSAAFGKLRV